MRIVVWLIVLFSVAVVAATALGANDGLVSLYWRGWRYDVSLNLFLAGLLAAGLVLYASLRVLGSLLSLPTRAREWRELQRERAAHTALRDAFSEHYAGRWRRADKAAQQALALQLTVPAIRGDHGLRMLAHIVSATSLHRLADRPRRDEMLREALASAAAPGAPRSVDDGLRMLAAEWMLEDNEADRAAELMAALPPGVARRTHALRLKLRVLRVQRKPVEALQTARLLAKHQGFSKAAAQALLRSLAVDAIDEACDAGQLRRVWQELDAADRIDPYVVSHAAIAMTSFWGAEEARRWLQPSWDVIARCTPDERECLSLALLAALEDIETDWLPRLEQATRMLPPDPSVTAAVGMAMAERQLWGKATVLLQQAVSAASLHSRLRRNALRWLARIAREQGDEARAARIDHEAAQMD